MRVGTAYWSTSRRFPTSGPPNIHGMPRERMSSSRWAAAADADGYQPYDPLNRVSLGRSVETALLARPLTSLGAVPPFWGTGIYVVYCEFGADDGDLYRRLGGTPAPLYVGRAVPRGARKGLLNAEEGRDSKALWSRLDEHRASVSLARDLDENAFTCRWLVSDPLFVPMAEALLIQTYRPVWNVLIDGFGNHDPGSGRYAQARSPWDTLHPGRPWADRLAPPPLDRDFLARAVAAHLDEHPPEEAPALPPVPVPGEIIPDPPFGGEPTGDDDGLPFDVVITDPPYGSV